jgi:hypothetical protein
MHDASILIGDSLTSSCNQITGSEVHTRKQRQQEKNQVQLKGFYMSMFVLKCLTIWSHTIAEIFFKLVSTTISRSLLWMFSHDGCIILLYLSTWPSVDPALVFRFWWWLRRSSSVFTLAKWLCIILLCFHYGFTILTGQ